jgi:hypothetical protein
MVPWCRVMVPWCRGATKTTTRWCRQHHPEGRGGVRGGGTSRAGTIIIPIMEQWCSVEQWSGRVILTRQSSELR